MLNKRKILNWVVGIGAAIFFSTAVMIKHYAIYASWIGLIKWVLGIGFVSYFLLYPMANRLLGVIIVRDGWKFSITIPKHNSELMQLTAFSKQLVRGAYLGFTDQVQFTDGLNNDDSVFKRKDFFAIFAAFALCFHFGLLNILFPIAFWYLTSKQLELAESAPLHIAATEILIGVGVFTINLLFQPGLWITALYPIIAVVWLILYVLRDTQLSYAVVALQFGKVLTYVSSTFIPYWILSHYTLPI